MSVDALAKRDTALAQRVDAADTNIDCVAARDRGKGGADHRPPPADGGRSARDRRRAAARQRSRAHRRSRQEHRQARDRAQRRIPAAQADPRRRAHDRSGARASSRPCSTPMRRRDVSKAMAVWRGDEEIDAVCTSVFRELLTYMMEDPRNITVLHPSVVLRQEHRAHGRPRHQHRRDRALHHRRPADRRPAAEGRHHDDRRLARPATDSKDPA